MKKAFYILSWLGIASAFILLLTIGFWMTYPYKTVTFNGDARVTNKTVVSGSYVHYEVDYCKWTNEVPLISKYFVDSIIYQLPEQSAIFSKMGCNVNHIEMYVPKVLQEGEYYVNIIYKYKVNPIRTITIELKTEKFKIISQQNFNSLNNKLND